MANYGHPIRFGVEVLGSPEAPGAAIEVAQLGRSSAMTSSPSPTGRTRAVSTR